MREPMMKSIRLLAVVLLSLSFATAARAMLDSEELSYEQWTVKCRTATPSPGACAVYWALQLPHGQDRSYLIVAVTYELDRLVLGAAVNTGDTCAMPASTMQVDGYPPVTLEPEAYVFLVPGRFVDEMINQFDNGTMLFLRIHMQPDCALSEYPIPLPEFSEAWSVMPQ